MTRLLAAAFVMGSAIALTAAGQTPPPAGSPGQPTAAAMSEDAGFVQKAVEGSRKEVALGKLANEKGTHADVKAFAQRMIADHGKALTELTALARSKSVQLPPEMTTPDPKLSGLSGMAFDRGYMDEMVKAHQSTIAMIEAELKDGKDADVKAWASKTLPTVREHLKQAQAAQAKVSATSSQPQ